MQGTPSSLVHPVSPPDVHRSEPAASKVYEYDLSAFPYAVNPSLVRNKVKHSKYLQPVTEKGNLLTVTVPLEYLTTFNTCLREDPVKVPLKAMAHKIRQDQQSAGHWKTAPPLARQGAKIRGCPEIVEQIYKVLHSPTNAYIANKVVDRHLCCVPNAKPQGWSLRLSIGEQGSATLPCSRCGSGSGYYYSDQMPLQDFWNTLRGCEIEVHAFAPRKPTKRPHPSSSDDNGGAEPQQAQKNKKRKIPSPCPPQPTDDDAESESERCRLTCMICNKSFTKLSGRKEHERSSKSCGERVKQKKEDRRALKRMADTVIPKVEPTTPEEYYSPAPIQPPPITHRGLIPTTTVDVNQLNSGSPLPVTEEQTTNRIERQEPIYMNAYNAPTSEAHQILEGSLAVQQAQQPVDEEEGLEERSCGDFMPQTDFLLSPPSSPTSPYYYGATCNREEDATHTDYSDNDKFALEAGGDYRMPVDDDDDVLKSPPHCALLARQDSQ
eukprot:TRINITY_DN51462_c0_g1_i1.p1 TRINITY_DN51462_c0_g1~~TRINITY_DN51462_c0_g1_i1.p1  ORF type:complete len:493 (+),score=38.91 TRINITY_DN51462_c0_g1_i1:83-1561(+)